MNRKSAYFAMLIFLLSMCSRFEDGPYFSLLSVKKRLARQWKVEYSINLESGVEHSADYDGWLLDFDKGGSFTKIVIYELNRIEYKGSWEITGSNKLVLEYNTSSGNISDEYVIQRLTQKQLWLKNTVEEIHYYSD